MAKLTDLSALATLLSPEETKKLESVQKKDLAKKKLGDGQTVRVLLDRKRRKGKTVTVVQDAKLPLAKMEELAKELKQLCGAGGTLKGFEIEIQGDQVAAVSARLREKGFTVKN